MPLPVRIRRSIQLEVELTRVVDLVELAPLASFGMDRRNLLGPTVDQSRMVGHAVSWLGCAGLLVPSACHSGTNLVIYTNQMAPADCVDITE